MTLPSLLTKLDKMEHNCFIGFHASAQLATNPKQFFSVPVSIGTTHLDPSRLVQYLSSAQNRGMIIGEHYNSVVRTLIRESTEEIRRYATETGQYTTIKFDDTFNFARIIRNSFAHDYVISLSKFYKGILSTRDIVWSGKSITLSMEGTPLDKTFFGYSDALALFRDLRTLCRDKLV